MATNTWVVTGDAKSAARKCTTVQLVSDERCGDKRVARTERRLRQVQEDRAGRQLRRMPSAPRGAVLPGGSERPSSISCRSRECDVGGSLILGTQGRMGSGKGEQPTQSKAPSQQKGESCPTIPEPTGRGATHLILEAEKQPSPRISPEHTSGATSTGDRARRSEIRPRGSSAAASRAEPA